MVKLGTTVTKSMAKVQKQAMPSSLKGKDQVDS